MRSQEQLSASQLEAANPWMRLSLQTKNKVNKAREAYQHTSDGGLATKRRWYLGCKSVGGMVDTIRLVVDSHAVALVQCQTAMDALEAPAH